MWGLLLLTAYHDVTPAVDVPSSPSLRIILSLYSRRRITGTKTVFLVLKPGLEKKFVCRDTLRHIPSENAFKMCDFHRILEICLEAMRDPIMPRHTEIEDNEQVTPIQHHCLQVLASLPLTIGSSEYADAMVENNVLCIILDSMAAFPDLAEM